MSAPTCPDCGRPVGTGDDDCAQPIAAKLPFPSPVAAIDCLRAQLKAERALSDALAGALKARIIEPVEQWDQVMVGPYIEDKLDGFMCVECTNAADTAAEIEHADGCDYVRDVSLLSAYDKHRAARAKEPGNGPR